MIKITKIRLQAPSIQSKLHSSYALPRQKAIIDHSTFETKETIDLKSNSRKSKFVAEEKQSLGNQINPGKIKLKGGSKILKSLGKSCSCNRRIEGFNQWRKKPERNLRQQELMFKMGNNWNNIETYSHK